MALSDEVISMADRITKFRPQVIQGLIKLFKQERYKNGSKSYSFFDSVVDRHLTAISPDVKWRNGRGFSLSG